VGLSPLSVESLSNCGKLLPLVHGWEGPGLAFSYQDSKSTGGFTSPSVVVSFTVA
jgi:hypothetical protein